MRSDLLKAMGRVATFFFVLSPVALHSQQASSTLAPKSVATPAVTPAITSTTVTTPGGTAGLMPMWTGTSTIGNSIVYQTSNGIGIGRFPNATLDIGGTSTFRGSMGISRAGDATTSAGANSFPILMQSSVYNKSLGKNVLPYFQLMTEPAGNNTASPGATLNFMYYSGVGAAPVESGLYINGNGTIHFASAQTFPSTANGITSVAHDSSLAGAGTSASPLGIAAVSHDSTITGNGTTASPLSLASPLNLPGSAYAKGFYGSNYNVNYAAVEGDDYSNDGVGVEGLSFNEGSGYAGYGMVAEGYIGIYAYGSHYAGDFDGNVYVGGTLSKAGGSFKIDHPLDPENKYLSHSFVESPDMKNIYDGNVVTDATGSATVTMPDYFEALNRDFRYQLTVIGQFAQAIVGTKISGNTFTIKTDKPNVEVSWQVTGIRQDAWANAHRIPNEEMKPTNERGRYLHPELFGHKEQPSIAASRLPQGLTPKQ